jgi:tRNA(Ile)-lysidine synthase
MQQHRFDHLLTAHHANDVVETVFINLLRGTGINGIKGISEKKENRVRPLLSFTKDEIERYAKKNDIHFRLDKSNLETKYERNFLRLEVIPKLKSINQNLEETFYKNSQRFSQEAGIVNDFLESKTKEITRTDSNYIKIDKRKLQSEKFKDSIINFILKPYHFNETQQKDVLTNISANAQIGKKFHSTTHRLTIDRNDIVVEPLEENKTEEISINSLAELKENKLLRFSNVKVFKTPLKTEIYIEKNKLIFPISIRPKKTGDKFKPFGMKGFKLLSDFLKDEKLNNFEKERCKLLVNGNGEIIWVMGKRSDERYRVNETENNLIKLTLIGE